MNELNVTGLCTSILYLSDHGSFINNSQYPWKGGRGCDGNKWGSQDSKVMVEASPDLGCQEAFVKDVVPQGRPALWETGR